MAVILIVIILSSAVMLITLDDGTYKEGDMGNVPYAASTYVKSIKFTEDGIKFIYTQFMIIKKCIFPRQQINL